MGRHTGNRDVVTKLQKALEDFLADQRTFQTLPPSDSLWQSKGEQMYVLSIRTARKGHQPTRRRTVVELKSSMRQNCKQPPRPKPPDVGGVFISAHLMPDSVKELRHEHTSEVLSRMPGID